MLDDKEILLDIFKNESFLVITNFNFNNISIFNINNNVYPIIIQNINIINKKILIELKKEYKIIVDFYNLIIDSDSIDSDIIINHFNINCNPRIDYSLVQMNKKELFYTRANIKKVLKIFNWKPKNSLRDIIKSVIIKYKI